MGWFTWFWDFLASLGWENKQGRILFLGLDNAGKTTLLGKLATDQIHVHRPTQHPNSEDLTLEGIKIKTIDMGGHADARRLWRDYFTNVNGVVFIVDAAARHRFEEAKVELNSLLETDELATTPFCILGNKIDMPNAVNDEALKQELGLTGMTTGKGKPPANVRPLEVFMCSVVKKQGYGEGFRWLAQFLQNI
jgi:GTP-binding protein SAR1